MRFGGLIGPGKKRVRTDGNRLHNMKGPSLGIIIATKTDYRGTYFYILNANGALMRSDEPSIRYSAEKAYASQSSMEKIIEWMDTAGPELEGTAKESIRVPEDIAIPLCERVRQYSVKVEEDFAKISMCAKPLYNMYAGYDKYVKIHLAEVARHVYGKLTNMSGYKGTLAAVRRLLVENPLLFRDEPSAHRFASTFYARPIDEVDLLTSFPNQIRQIQEQYMRLRAEREGIPSVSQRDSQLILAPFKTFIETCQELIDKSRALQKGYGQNRFPIKPIVYEGFRFDTHFQRDLIRFIRSVFHFGAGQKNPAFSLVPWIVRQTGRYDDVEQITMTTVRKFLIEIGMDSPWESPIKSLGLMAGLEGPKNEEKLKRYDDEARKDKEGVLEKYGLEDKMKDYRKDWGDMPIYAIDSVSTVDVDDGISIEEVGDDKAWIHVHVANPTAFISTDHELAEYARENFSKIYLPDRHIDMLPRFLNYSFFGLGPNRPAITFSGLYNKTTGELLDISITNSTVHNLRRIPYDTINNKLNLTASMKDGEKFVFGKIKPSPESTDPATYLEGAVDDCPIDLNPPEHDLENLRKLQTLTKIIHKRRIEAGAVAVRAAKPVVTIDDGLNGKGLSSRPAPPDTPVLYSGIPNVIITKPLLGATHSAEDIVAECMIQAGHIGAVWLQKKNIPAPFRASMSSTLVQSPQVERTWNSILAMRDSEGFLPPSAMQHPNWRHLSLATITTEPRPHRLMGLSCYTQVTSPLRRFPDFLTHHQIEACLRNGRDSLPAEDYPYNLDALKSTIQYMLDQMTRFKYLALINDGYWRLQGLLTAIWSGDERIVGRKVRAKVLRQSVSTLSEMDVELLEWNVRVTLKAKKEDILRMEEGEIVEGTIAPELCDYMRVVIAFERKVPAAELLAGQEREREERKRLEAAE